MTGGGREPDAIVDEGLLEALLAGEVDAADPAIAARLARAPATRARWLELSALARAIDASGPVREQVLREGAAAERDESEILDGFRAQIARARAPARHLPRGWLLAAATLFVVLGGYAIYSSRGDPNRSTPSPGHRYLAGGEIELLGDLPFGVLRWRVVHGDRVEIQVNVRAYAVNASGERGALLASALDVAGSEFALDAAVRERNQRLEFELEVLRQDTGVPIVDVVRQAR